jgi:AcrR family transcriptional regulator
MMSAEPARATPLKAGRQSRGRPPLDDAARQRILDATAAVFLEKGFAGAGTSEIARRACTSKQTLYSLFPTKADLFVGVISAHTNQLFARHVEFIESNQTPSETLREIGYMLLSMFAAPQFLALYRILVAEAHNFPDLSRQLWSECMERGYTLLAEYLKARRIGGPSYRKSAAQFISFVLGDFVVNAMLNPDLRLSERMLRSRVHEAVRDFLLLHPEHPFRK